MDKWITKVPVLGAAIVALMVIGVLGLERSEESARTAFQVEPLSAASAIGTPARLEREYKLRLTGGDVEAFLTDEGMAKLVEAVYLELRNSLASSSWQAPAVSGNPYYVEREPLRVVTRDIYFDDARKLALANDISYRLRHRFTSPNRLHRHETRPTDRSAYPYRGEIQSKVDRKELGGGFSTVEEARLEFRRESAPFSTQRPPPPAPWLPRDFIPVAQSGRFEAEVTTPAASLSRFLKSRGARGEIYWSPVLILLSTRMRLHLNNETDFGSGPNPNQAFIVTVDRVDVCEAIPYIRFLEAGWYGNTTRPRPQIAATFFEVEIEFERNVSTRLDEALAASPSPSAQDLRTAFLADQRLIRGIVVDSFSALGLSLQDASGSKYDHASRVCKGRAGFTSSLTSVFRGEQSRQ